MEEHFLYSELPMENIFKSLDRLRSHNIGDVRIICKDGTILAHKIILASVSEMLQEEFSGNFRDEILSILAPDLDRESVSRCLDSLYNRREVSRDETFINLICGKKEHRRQKEPKLEEVTCDEGEESRLDENDDENRMEDHDIGSSDEENVLEDEMNFDNSEPSYVDDWIATPFKSLNEEPDDQTEEKDPIQGQSSVEMMLSKDKKCKKKSGVWLHFVRVTKKVHGMMSFHSQCNHCGKVISGISGTTTHLWRHLKNHHPGYQSMASPTVIKFTSQNVMAVKEENIDQGSGTLDTSDEDEGDDDDDYKGELKQPNKNKSHRRSVVWRHFMSNPENPSETMCFRCGKIITYHSSTTLFRHLQNYHMETERARGVEKHFSVTPNGAMKCNYCDQVVTRNRKFSSRLSMHLGAKHPDIFDREEHNRTRSLMDRKGLEQLPIVEPIFDNFEEARAHAETEQQEIAENSFEKESKSKGPGRNRNEFAWRHVSKRLDPLTGKNCVACLLCDKTFHQKKGQKKADARVIIAHLYRAHQIRDPEDEAHVCSQCGRSFALRSELYNHEWNHKEREPYQCPRCEKTFKNSGSLRVHKRLVHLHPGEKAFQERMLI